MRLPVATRALPAIRLRAGARTRDTMIEIMRTNDLVLLSAVDALLTSAAIEFMIADQHMSSLEGSVGFLPRRLLVPADRVDRARRLLREAGLAHSLLHE